MSEGLSDQQRQQITDALSAGQKIEAIKLYRQFTGSGLKEAVDAIEASIEHGTVLQWPAQSNQQGTLDPEQRKQVVDLLAAGQKIQAIKLYREFTGAGLAEAKTAVEAMEGQGGAPMRKRSTGCGPNVLAMIVVVVAGVWIVVAALT